MRTYDCFRKYAVHAPFERTRRTLQTKAQCRRISCRAVTGAVSRSERVELETLAREILKKENEIKNAFQPGRPMPSGSQVAQMRREAKELREALASKVNSSAASGDSISTNKEISSLITAVAAAQARESMNNVTNQMKNATPANVLLDDGTMLDEKDVLELEMLQLENEQLRAQASALLMRQHFLEELMQENNLTLPQLANESTSEAALKNGHGKSTENDEAESSSGYYMSSPSYY